MTLKISKKDFFDAYADLQFPKAIRSEGRRIRVLESSSSCGKSFSLSHKLNDILNLIKVEGDRKDKKRLIEIGKAVYIREHKKHFCLMYLLFAIRNAIQGRGFFTAKKFYHDIEVEEMALNLQLRKINQTPPIKDVTDHKKIRIQDPKDDFREFFNREIKPLSAKEIEKYAIKKRAPFNLFYSEKPSENLVYIGRNLTTEQLTGLQKGIFQEHTHVLHNFCICINANSERDKLYPSLIEFLNAKGLLKKMPEIGKYFLLGTKTISGGSILSYVEHYFRFALKQDNWVDLLDYFSDTDRFQISCELLSEKSSFKSLELPEPDRERFFIWARRNGSNLIRSLSPYYCDMSKERFLAAVKDNKGNLQELKKIFAHLHSTNFASLDLSPFKRNFVQAISLFSNEEIERLAEQDIFELKDAECSKEKLQLIGQAISNEQYCSLIRGSGKFENPLFVFRNLVLILRSNFSLKSALPTILTSFSPGVWTDFFQNYEKDNNAKLLAIHSIEELLKGTDKETISIYLNKLANIPPLLTMALERLDSINFDKMSPQAKECISDWSKGKQWEEACVLLIKKNQ